MPLLGLDRKHWKKLKDPKCYICSYPVYLPGHPEGKFEFNNKNIDLCVACSRFVNRMIEGTKGDFDVEDRIDALEDMKGERADREYKELKKRKMQFLELYFKPDK